MEPQRHKDTNLEAYGLGGAALRFYYEAGNTLYRVYDATPDASTRIRKKRCIEAQRLSCAMLGPNCELP